MGKSYVAHCQSGHYCYDRFVHVQHALTNHPYSQCGYDVTKDGTTLFISYETIVCEIDKEGWFNLRGEFSTTTSKQICWFLREWCKENHSPYIWGYMDVKVYYKKNKDVNLLTHETREHIPGVIQTVGVRVNND